MIIEIFLFFILRLTFLIIINEDQKYKFKYPLYTYYVSKFLYDEVVCYNNLNQLFKFYAIDDDITQYYLAIENINSVFMERLAPYVKERTWSSLQHGINKVCAKYSFIMEF